MKINRTPIYPCRYFQVPNHAFELALLNDENQVYFTPFECKDYLQDIFWSHRTGNEAELYGIKCTPNMIDDKAEWFRLGIFGGKENMREKIPHILEFINTFDDAQGIPRTSIEETEKDDEIVIVFSRKWTQNGPLLSTFTTAIRLSGAYTGGDVLEYLKKLYESRNVGVKPLYMQHDVSRLNVTLPKFAAVLAGKKIDLPWKELASMMYAHNTGIVGWTKFPTVEVK